MISKTVLVCGSRNYPDKENCLYILDNICKEYNIYRIISGGAKGPDQWAIEYAKYKNIKVDVFPAEWDKYGKIAGYKRNLDMLQENPDLVLAFWDGESKGTEHTIKNAVQKDIEVRIF